MLPTHHLPPQTQHAWSDSEGTELRIYLHLLTGLSKADWWGRAVVCKILFKGEGG